MLTNLTLLKITLETRIAQETQAVSQILAAGGSLELSLRKDSYIHISVLLFRGNKSWTRLSSQLLLLWTSSCDIFAANVTSPKIQKFLSWNPPVKSDFLCTGFWHSLLWTICWGVECAFQSSHLGYWSVWRIEEACFFFCGKSYFYHIVLRYYLSTRWSFCAKKLPVDNKYYHLPHMCISFLWTEHADTPKNSLYVRNPVS